MSFAKEIEDFLNGYKTVSDMVGSAEDRAMKRDVYARQKDKDEQAEMDELAIDAEEYLPGSVKAAMRRAPKKASASTTTEQAIPDLSEPYPDLDDGVAMAAGGLVPDDIEKDEPVQQALPIDNPVAAKARAEGKSYYLDSNNARHSLVAMNGKARNTYADDQSLNNGGGNSASNSASKSVGPGLKEIFAKSDEAIRAAFNGFKGAAGNRTAIGGDPDMDLASGRGAATPAEVKAIDQKIDPNNEMDTWSRGRARLGYAYDYFVSRGEPEKAMRVAQRLLLFDKMASQARGKIAMQLLSSGSGDKAASVLADAYNDNIHDGSVLSVTPSGNGQFSYRVSKDGEVVDEGVASSQDLAGMASSVADGSEFVRRTSRIAAGAAGAAGGDPTEQGAGNDTDPAGNAAATDTPAAIPDAIPAEAPEQPEAVEKEPAKGKRDIVWAKRQYVHAASVMKYWQDAVANDPSPENQARLRDAQIRLSEAGQDAARIRLSTTKKGADQSQILLALDKDMADWLDSADPPEAEPAAPKDGLRGAPKTDATAGASGGAIPDGAQPGNAPSSTPPDIRFNIVDSKSAYWLLGNGKAVRAPRPENLKPVPPEMATQAKAAIAAGKSRTAVLETLLNNGFDPRGI